MSKGRKLSSPPAITAGSGVRGWWAALAVAAFSSVVSTTVIAGTLAGCARHVEPDRRLQAASDTEWDWLVAAKRRLDEQRARLAALGQPAVSPPSAAPGATPRDRLAGEVDSLAAELGRRLVAYINSRPPIEDWPLTARQLAAIRMKSDEEIAVAHEYITRSGDYRRACEIYEAALASDPQNPHLREELARAQAARFMTAERFSRVSPGMTAEQVRAALGPPNAHDVRRDPGRGVVGWFYPKDAGGSAAAVWFEQRDGQLTAFASEWAALGPAPAAALPGAAGTDRGIAAPAPPSEPDRKR